MESAMQEEMELPIGNIQQYNTQIGSKRIFRKKVNRPIAIQNLEIRKLNIKTALLSGYRIERPNATIFIKIINETNTDLWKHNRSRPNLVFKIILKFYFQSVLSGVHNLLWSLIPKTRTKNI